MLFFLGSYMGRHREVTASDEYIRNRVVKLFSPQGSCTGVEVLAPSNKNYILSAGHCSELADSNHTISAKTEKGKIYKTKILQVDAEHDLMLLAPVDDNSIVVAKSDFIHQHVHTLTHGKGYPTYRTDGELLETKVLRFIVYPIDSAEDLERCVSATNQVPEFNDDKGLVCVTTLTSMMSTAEILPGSSGGPVLDSWGHLVGIVSNTDGVISGFVPIEDIIIFLASR